jgi:hypothetical protein
VITDDSPEPMITMFMVEGGLIYLDKREHGTLLPTRMGSRFWNCVGSTMARPVWMLASSICWFAETLSESRKEVESRRYFLQQNARNRVCYVGFTVAAIFGPQRLLSLGPAGSDRYGPAQMLIFMLLCAGAGFTLAWKLTARRRNSAPEPTFPMSGTCCSAHVTAFHAPTL